MCQKHGSIPTQVKECTNLEIIDMQSHEDVYTFNDSDLLLIDKIMASNDLRTGPCSSVMWSLRTPKLCTNHMTNLHVRASLCTNIRNEVITDTKQIIEYM